MDSSTMFCLPSYSHFYIPISPFILATNENIVKKYGWALVKDSLNHKTKLQNIYDDRLGLEINNSKFKMGQKTISMGIIAYRYGPSMIAANAGSHRVADHDESDFAEGKKVS